jgi:hypothetical protein
MTTEMSKLYENEFKITGIEEDFKWFDFVYLDLT